MKKIILFIICLSVFSISSSLFSKKASEKVIKIGIVRGNFFNGEMIEKAAKMAIDEINTKGGILGRKLVPVIIEDDFKLLSVQFRLHRAIETDKIDFIVGGFNSSVVIPAMDIMARFKKLWLGTGGASPYVIKKIMTNYNKYKYYFRVGTIGAFVQGNASANFIINHIGPKYNLNKIALIGLDHAYSRFMHLVTKRKLLNEGYEIEYEKYFPSETKDFSKAFSDIKKSGAKIIIQAWPGTESIVFIKQFYAQKIPAVLVGTVIEAVKDEYFHKTGGMCVFQTDFSPQAGPAPITKKTKVFAAAFKKKYKKSAGHVAYPAYDAIYLLKAAIEKSKSFDSELLIKTLEKLEYEGNIWYKFTKFHDLTQGIFGKKIYANMLWFQWQADGTRKAVYPEKVKEAEYKLAPWVKKAFKEAGIIK